MNITPVAMTQLPELLKLYDEFDRPKDAHLEITRAREVLNDIRAQNGEVFVAIRERSLLGSYTVFVCSNLTRRGCPFAVVENVICRDTERRRGVGRSMMEHAKTHALQHGCYKIYLQTGAKNASNHAFYESCGFSSTKRGYEMRFMK